MSKCTTFKSEKLPLRGFLLIALLVFRARCEAGDKRGGYVICGLGRDCQERRLLCVVSCLFCFRVVQLHLFEVSAQHLHVSKIDMKCLLAAITSEKNGKTNEHS